MVSEGTEIRRFVSRELHRCSDLSTLTLGILRKKYLEHVGRDSLSAEHRQLLKQILEEELMEMQDSSSDDEPLIRSVAPSKKQSKRKREDEDEALNKEDMSRKKKSRFAPDSPDSPDSGIEKIANEELVKEEADYEHDDDEGSDQNIEEESEEEQNAIQKKVQQKNTKEKSNATKRNRKGDMSSESDEEEEKNKAKKNGKVLDSEEDGHISCSSSDEDKENQQVHARGEKKSNSEEEKVSEKEVKCKDIGNRKKAKGRSGNKKQNVSSDSLEEMSGEEPKPKGEKKGVGKRIKADGQKTRKKTEDKKEHKSTESEAVRKVQKEVFGSSSESEEDEAKKTERKGSSESSDEGSDKEPEKEDDKVSSDEETAKAKNVRNEADDSDSSSSSLPSLEDDEEAEGTKPKQEEGKKKKSAPKKKSTEMSESKDNRGKEDENKAVSRLKRYLALCGVRRNYKKLFEGCRSVKAKVAVLKKELEELGVEGQPSIEKCKKARMKREEAQELAELDVSNIITAQGRPKRRAAATWTNLQSSSPLPSAYKRVVNSDSDSEDGSTHRGRKRTTDWSNLRGIISDDAASD